jgi:hypothetical protein
MFASAIVAKVTLPLTVTPLLVVGSLMIDPRLTSGTPITGDTLAQTNRGRVSVAAMKATPEPLALPPGMPGGVIMFHVLLFRVASPSLSGS